MHRSHLFLVPISIALSILSIDKALSMPPVCISKGFTLDLHRKTKPHMSHLHPSFLPGAGLRWRHECIKLSTISCLAIANLSFCRVACRPAALRKSGDSLPQACNRISGCVAHFDKAVAIRRWPCTVFSRAATIAGSHQAQKSDPSCLFALPPIGVLAKRRGFYKIFRQCVGGAVIEVDFMKFIDSPWLHFA